MVLKKKKKIYIYTHTYMSVCTYIYHIHSHIQTQTHRHTHEYAPYVVTVILENKLLMSGVENVEKAVPALPSQYWIVKQIGFLSLVSF